MSLRLQRDHHSTLSLITSKILTLEAQSRVSYPFVHIIYHLLRILLMCIFSLRFCSLIFNPGFALVVHSETLNNLVNCGKATHIFIKMPIFLTIQLFNLTFFTFKIPPKLLILHTTSKSFTRVFKFLFPLSHVFQVLYLLSLLQFPYSLCSQLSILCHQGTSFTSVNNPSFLKKEDTTSKAYFNPFSKPLYMKTSMNQTSISPKRT